MPTYEYACTSCRNEWEAEQSMKDAALTECPACHQQTAKRQISRGTGFILKGGGWYSDLYSSASNKSGGSEKSEGSEGKTSDTKSSDTKSSGGDKGGSSDGGSTSSSGGTSGSSTSSGGSSAKGASASAA